jgi:hypothetical protein
MIYFQLHLFDFKLVAVVWVYTGQNYTWNITNHGVLSQVCSFKLWFKTIVLCTLASPLIKRMFKRMFEHYHHNHFNMQFRKMRYKNYN